MKNVLNRILKIISSAIFVVLVIIIVLILAYVIRVRYLASHGRLGDVKLNFYTILTQSMVPTIYPGDVVVTYKTADNKYDNGDILTYVSDLNGGINITHRIIKTYVVNGKYSYKTKGDNNSVPDSEIVKGERVLGKVVLKIPKVGHFQQFLVTQHRWIIVVVIPCLGIIIYDVLKMIKGFRKEKEYTEPEVFNDITIPAEMAPPMNNNSFESNNYQGNQNQVWTPEKSNDHENLEKPVLSTDNNSSINESFDHKIITPSEGPNIQTPENHNNYEKVQLPNENTFQNSEFKKETQPEEVKENQSNDDNDDIEFL